MLLITFYSFCSYISSDKFIIEPRGVNEQLVISRVSKDVTVQGNAEILLVTTMLSQLTFYLF